MTTTPRRRRGRREGPARHWRLRIGVQRADAVDAARLLRLAAAQGDAAALGTLGTHGRRQGSSIKNSNRKAAQPTCVWGENAAAAEAAEADATEDMRSSSLGSGCTAGWPRSLRRASPRPVVDSRYLGCLGVLGWPPSGLAPRRHAPPGEIRARDPARLARYGRPPARGYGVTRACRHTTSCVALTAHHTNSRRRKARALARRSTRAVSGRAR